MVTVSKGPDKAAIEKSIVVAVSASISATRALISMFRGILVQSLVATAG